MLVLLMNDGHKSNKAAEIIRNARGHFVTARSVIGYHMKYDVDSKHKLAIKSISLSGKFNA